MIYSQCFFLGTYKRINDKRVKQTQFNSRTVEYRLVPITIFLVSYSSFRYSPSGMLTRPVKSDAEVEAETRDDA